jgi:hypothetical protein
MAEEGDQQDRLRSVFIEALTGLLEEAEELDETIVVRGRVGVRYKHARHEMAHALYV